MEKTPDNDNPSIEDLLAETLAVQDKMDRYQQAYRETRRRYYDLFAELRDRRDEVSKADDFWDAVTEETMLSFWLAWTAWKLDQDLPQASRMVDQRTAQRRRQSSSR